MAVKARAGWARNKLAATPAAARRVNCLGLDILKSLSLADYGVNR